MSQKSAEVMSALYETYGTQLEALGFKPNKAKSLYKRKSKTALSELEFNFAGRSDGLHLIFSHTDPAAAKLHKQAENAIRLGEGQAPHNFPRPTLCITDWKYIFTRYGRDCQTLTGWFTSVPDTARLHEKTRAAYSFVIGEILPDLLKRFDTADGLENLLWKTAEDAFYGGGFDRYHAANLLCLGLAKGRNGLEENRRRIHATPCYASAHTDKEAIEGFYRILKSLPDAA